MLGDLTYNVNAPANRLDDSLDQVWTTGGLPSVQTLLLEIAGHRAGNEFGLYNLTTGVKLPVFPGTDAGVTSKTVTFDSSGNATVGTTTKLIGATFGFYLAYGNTTFYSHESDNPETSGPKDHMVTLVTTGPKTLNLSSYSPTYTSGGTIPWHPGEFLLAWEDLPLTSGDSDYQDMIVKVAVPEPTTMLAGALLLLPFAASTIRRLRNG